MCVPDPRLSGAHSPRNLGISPHGSQSRARHISSSLPLLPQRLRALTQSRHFVSRLIPHSPSRRRYHLLPELATTFPTPPRPPLQLHLRVRPAAPRKRRASRLALYRLAEGQRPPSRERGHGRRSLRRYPLCTWTIPTGPGLSITGSCATQSGGSRRRIEKDAFSTDQSARLVRLRRPVPKSGSGKRKTDTEVFDIHNAHINHCYA
jgi:hypothetical protein